MPSFSTMISNIFLAWLRRRVVLGEEEHAHAVVPLPPPRAKPSRRALPWQRIGGRSGAGCPRRRRSFPRRPCPPGAPASPRSSARRPPSDGWAALDVHHGADAAGVMLKGRAVKAPVCFLCRHASCSSPVKTAAVGLPTAAVRPPCLYRYLCWVPSSTSCAVCVNLAPLFILFFWR